MDIPYSVPDGDISDHETCCTRAYLEAQRSARDEAHACAALPHSNACKHGGRRQKHIDLATWYSIIQPLCQYSVMANVVSALTYTQHCGTRNLDSALRTYEQCYDLVMKRSMAKFIGN